ncbi:MAG: DUF5671 domain-containing protein [Patescibacteria group bacterium]
MQLSNDRVTSIKDAFMHLLSIIMLYAGAISFLVLVFQITNIKFPDILDFNGYNSYALENCISLIRGALAFLIVTYPVYIVSFYFLKKSYEASPEKKQFVLRKFLVYFTLFIAALIIVGNLIALLAGFLYGELTLRFILKILSIFFVAGSTFGYYIYDLKDKHEKTLRYVAIMVSLVVLVFIILGFFFIGSPFNQRLRRIDTEKRSSLENISYNIDSYMYEKKALPESLEIIKNKYNTNITDPQTQKEYTYEVIDKDNYKLCAEFNLPSISKEYTDKYSLPASQDIWEHDKGTVCFTKQVNIDPAFMKEGLETAPIIN